MGITSKKLYGVKKSVLRKNISKIDVSSNKELLLLEAPSEFKSTYRALGVRSKQDFVHEQLKESRELKIFQDKYKNAEAFKGSHIKKLCNTYDLMIRPISDIEGYLNDEAMKACQDFTERFKGTSLSDSNLYILAAREAFYSTYSNKEVKTFIIFYNDDSNHSTTSYREVQEDDVVNQIHSSGNDFNTLRVFCQLFLLKRYTKGSDKGVARFYSNLAISFWLWLSILAVSGGSMIASTILFSIFLVSMALNNSREEYKKCWNQFSDGHTER